MLEFTPATTSGTFGSARYVLLLSITRYPSSTSRGTYRLL